MKYVSAQRLIRAIVNLSTWGEHLRQRKTHAAIFLSSKLKGMNADSPIEFRDNEDKRFWNEYMRISGNSEPYYDPIARTSRSQQYPHNSAFKARNDRWTSDDFQIATRLADNMWQFAPDYVERLRIKTMTHRETLHPYPEPDLVAWLYRTTPFSDSDDLNVLRARFRSDFNLTEAEIEGLFSSQDWAIESEDEFFASRRLSDELVTEIATNATSEESLDELLATVAEQSEPQPVEPNDIANLAREGRGQLILQGPPGTGKTYLARQAAALLLGAHDDTITDVVRLKNFLASHLLSADDPLLDQASGYWEIVQFHPSFSYEDFVRGISSEVHGDRPVFAAKNRTMARVAEFARDRDKPVVLIIDEINRGDISKILGELIFALEYRGEPVQTLYEVDGSYTIAIPDNVKIIATMNTADRSIALIDFAIRRRFDFVDVPASRHSLEKYLTHGPSTPEKIDKVLALFDAANRALPDDADHKVGQTYFMSHESDEIARRFVFQVLPLLAEYQREGIVGQNLRLRPNGWLRDTGIPLSHPRPFDLVEQISRWL